MDNVENKVFPNNSLTKREEPNEPVDSREHKAPVAKATKVGGRKKGPLSKIFNVFIVEDLDTVKNYIFFDFIVPGIKNLFLDTLSMMLWGEGRPSNNVMPKSSITSRVSYSKMYSGNQVKKPVVDNRRNYEYDDALTFATRGEAEQVLETMLEAIDVYGFVSVADLYDFAEVDPQYQKWTDNKYGWTNLSRATTKRTRDGYTLALPKAMPIDD